MSVGIAVNESREKVHDRLEVDIYVRHRMAAGSSDVIKRA